jgi:hypothetical protein
MQALVLRFPRARLAIKMPHIYIAGKPLPAAPAEASLRSSSVKAIDADARPRVVCTRLSYRCNRVY